LKAGLPASIGTVGDDAIAESVNALYKAELFYWEGPCDGPTTSSSPRSAGSITPGSIPGLSTVRQPRSRPSTIVTRTPLRSDC